MQISPILKIFCLQNKNINIVCSFFKKRKLCIKKLLMKKKMSQTASLSTSTNIELNFIIFKKIYFQNINLKKTLH